MSRIYDHFRKSFSFNFNFNFKRSHALQKHERTMKYIEKGLGTNLENVWII